VRTKGKITFWNDEKGYGFIVPRVGGTRTFVHIKAFKKNARRPVVGDLVTYVMSSDSRGRPCADKATISSVPKTLKRNSSSGILVTITALGFLLFVAGAVLESAIPLPVIFFYLFVSVTTFAAYLLDKIAAKRGNWRTNENTLHLLSLVGGWPGALIAQNYLRHKTKKQPFRAFFWITVVLNCAAFAWLLTPQGANAWRLIIGSVT
jgi:uncharacterized membrane protein YsdA (DUF1294 family)/cold shock CspA family protein